jgi:hypothetical protein
VNTCSYPGILPYPADVFFLQEWSEEKYVKTETGIYNYIWLVGSKIKESTPLNTEAMVQLLTVINILHTHDTEKKASQAS